MNECKLHLKLVGNGSGSLGTTGVRADYNRALVVRHVLTNPPHHQLCAVHIVHGNVVETLRLRIMQIHGDQVIATRRHDHVGNQRARTRDPVTITVLDQAE